MTKDTNNEHLKIDLKPFDWYGGKGHMAHHILPHIPEWREVYCEPFGGGASLFFNMPAKPIEIYNDVDGRLVNFFRVLQKREKYVELQHMLDYTLYSYEEYQKALELQFAESATDVERAWAFFVIYNSSFSATGRTKGNWSACKKTEGQRSERFRKRVNVLDVFHKRFEHVYVDHRDAIECIKKFATDKTFFYLDPPYPAETRKSVDAYYYETSDELHTNLVDCMLSNKGMFVLSCYWHDVYKPLLDAGYRMIEFNTVCYANVSRSPEYDRTEVLLVSPNVPNKQLKLF